MEEKTYYPCCWCGSCPVWLAAFEPKPHGLPTMEDIEAACKTEKCAIFGTQVPQYLINESKEAAKRLCQ